jgi:HAD superfamily hydrolase (TIGR01509 family)
VIRGVILDVDGTLVDSNRQHAQAWFDAFTEAGLSGGTALDLQRLIGMGSDKLIPAAVGLPGDGPEAERLGERRAAIFRELYLPALRPTPGATALVEALRDRDFELAVASSARPDELRSLLEAAGVPWLAERATSGEQVDESKPEPDVIEAALGRLGLAPDEVVLIGDTPYDVEAGIRAGVTVDALRCGGWDDVSLREAAAVYRDPAELLEGLDASPIGSAARPARPAAGPRVNA